MLHAGLGYLRIVRTEWGDVIVRTMLARGTFHSVGLDEKGGRPLERVFAKMIDFLFSIFFAVSQQSMGDAALSL